jgi:histidine triad (HIT) family protein
VRRLGVRRRLRLSIDPVTAWTYTGDDFYCDLAIPRASELDVVYEDERTLAYHHTKPFWPTHVVVVPKRHLASLTALVAEDEPDVRALFSVVQQVARDIEVAEGAAGVLTNLGSYQDSKHLHVHVYSGKQLR